MTFLFKINYYYFEEWGRQTTCRCQNRSGSNGFTKTHLDMRKNYKEKWRMSDDLTGGKKYPTRKFPSPSLPKKTPNSSNNKTQLKKPPKHKKTPNSYQNNNLDSWICCREGAEVGLIWPNVLLCWSHLGTWPSLKLEKQLLWFWFRGFKLHQSLWCARQPFQLRWQ